MRFNLNDWLYGILFLQWKGWHKLDCKYWWLSVGLTYKSISITPSTRDNFDQFFICHCVSLKRVYHLRLNHICSETNSFDKCCNDLERFLLERGYSSKLVRKEIFWAIKIPRNELLDKERAREMIAS